MKRFEIEYPPGHISTFVAESRAAVFTQFPRARIIRELGNGTLDHLLRLPTKEEMIDIGRQIRGDDDLARPPYEIERHFIPDLGHPVNRGLGIVDDMVEPELGWKVWGIRLGLIVALIVVIIGSIFMIKVR